MSLAVVKSDGLLERVQKKLLTFPIPARSNSLILSCVLIDQVVPFDRGARYVTVHN
jgi:hypothetical protein